MRNNPAHFWRAADSKNGYLCGLVTPSEMADVYVNQEAQLAREFIANTDSCLFLTGRAGTGKTTFLRELVRRAPKQKAVLAPTGVAAINAGGVTIHSFFQLPFGPIVVPALEPRDPWMQVELPPSLSTRPFRRDKLQLIRRLELLVIDEISMVRADVMDAIDAVLRTVRRNQLPFGGVQLLMIGDMHQLPPVAKEGEWTLLRNYYASPYFFESQALRRADFIRIELRHVYRQRDAHFIELLDKVRINSRTPDLLSTLNKRYQPGAEMLEEEGRIVLTTHNRQAQRINEARLNALPGESYTYSAKISGEFPESSFPTDQTLELKVGAQVMFIKNDPGILKRYYNGKIGIVEALDEEGISVRFAEEDETVEVELSEWENLRYEMNAESRAIAQESIGTFTQYPLRLAWAITIHKSQGLTFDRVTIEGAEAFASGQMYVALSRCRTLEGIMLSSPIGGNALVMDTAILQLARTLDQTPPNQQMLQEAERRYARRVLAQLFDFSEIAHAAQEAQHRTQALPLADPDEREATAKILEELLRLSKIYARFGVELADYPTTARSVNELPELTERIGKACAYALGHLGEQASFVAPLCEITLQTRSAEEELSGPLIATYRAAYVKALELASCADRFDVQQYLLAHGRALVEADRLRAPSIESSVDRGSEVLKALAAWRYAAAEQTNTPAHTLLKQQTLLLLAATLPVTMDELLRVKGIGRTFASRYGNEIIDLCRQYKGDGYMDFEPTPPAEKKSKRPNRRQPARGESQAETVNLLLQGISLEDIAERRGLKLNTLVGHVVWGIANGSLDISVVMPQERILTIMKSYADAPDLTLNERHSALKGDYYYGELRWVREWMKREGKLPQNAEK